MKTDKLIKLIRNQELNLVQVDEENSTIITCPKCLSHSHIIKKGHGGDKDKQRYQCKECGRKFIKTDYQHNHLTLNEDIWDACELGLKVSPYRKESKLVFSRIQQKWLKDAVKKFIKYNAVNKSYCYLQKQIYHLSRLSKFLSIYYPSVQFESITRQILVDFVSFLSREKLNNETKNKHLTTLKLFFESGKVNSWFNVQDYLIRKEDYGKITRPLPRYIPEEVMQQLNEHLDELPNPVTRMVLVIQETGLRIGELLQLPIDCLKSDGNGNAYLQYINWKMNKEDTKPISPELEKVIREQQQYIKQYLGANFKYLFSARKPGVVFRPKAAVMSKDSFIKFLKDLATKFDIKDNTGKPWNFQSHQFRHTVGTRMINAGVPQHIIQRYLGHESPTMTSVYAHIHDQTLRKEIEKYHETRVVNFQGESVELEKTVLSSNNDLEWFKKNVLAMALPHGYCGRPKVLGFCNLPTESCYDCPHWRTNKNFLPVLKDTLLRTNNIINKAHNCGWELQVAKNQPIRDNLEKVVKVLEEDENNE